MSKTWGELVREHFPKADDDLIDFILWELTCFPMSTATATKQVQELAKKVRPLEDGWKERLAEAARDAEESMNSAMAVDSEAPTQSKEERHGG